LEIRSTSNFWVWRKIETVMAGTPKELGIGSSEMTLILPKDNCW
jgi:hypothetical protein